MARILIIEDDPNMRSLLELTLRSAGHQVQSAPHGGEGLKCQAASPAELVITDIFMPEKEGLETIRALRRADPKLKIMAMTGLPDLGDPLTAARRLGANSTLEKPFQPHELLAAVQELLLAKN